MSSGAGFEELKTMPHACPPAHDTQGFAAILTLESVPPVTTTRWIPRRKAQVVRAVEAGLLTRDEACRLYRLSEEELESWRRALHEDGEAGLRITRRAHDWELEGAVPAAGA
jgi:hypothetical protein